MDDRSRLEQQPTQAAHPPPINEPERAARKMDLDDNYDDEEPEEKKPLATAGPAPPPGSAPGEKTHTPTSGGMNGMLGNSKDGA
jgi:general transcriptional corepressor CYC8